MMNESPQYDQVLLRKAQTIERCVARARQEYEASEGNFLSSLSHQDAAILNLQRACEAALDMAQRVISQNGWGIAESSKDLFSLLQRHQVLSAEMASSLVRMVGFRNLAVHDYQELDMAIVQAIIEKQTQDLLDFSEQMLKQFFKKVA
jgi:uncharacterized protein YutE (UPF0331/DUF86 family)